MKKKITAKGKPQSQALPQTPNKNCRTCTQGHSYFKTSDCPTCPVCEAANKPDSGFLSRFYAPARRALENAGITNATQLARYTQAQVMALHGMGKASLPALLKALKDEGKSFSKPG